MNATNEVSKQELTQLGIKVELTDKEIVEWVKDMDITYEGVSCHARLRWDTYSGYELTLDDDAPAILHDLADRPEFEYILDDLTEENN